MEFNEDKKDLLTRLACCAIGALILYVGLEHLMERHTIPQLEPYRPWLAENKVQTIAVAAAVLFGLSLVLLPPKSSPGGAEDPDCEYRPVDSCPT